MRHSPFSFLLLAAGLAAACGSEAEPISSAPASTPTGSGATSGERSAADPGDRGDHGATGSFCSASPPACGAARPVASADDLLAEIAKAPWQSVSLSKTGVLTLSSDLVAEADLTIDAAVLTKPSSCGDFCNAPLFRDYAFPAWNGPGVPGVTCAEKGPHPVRKGDTCSKITIAKDTTFRIRAVVEDMHPSAPTYWPFVELAPSCATPCADGEQRCAGTQTCFARGYASCAYCEGEAAATCACRTDCGTEPNGTECSYDTSPDTIAVGACRSGTCESN